VKIGDRSIPPLRRPVELRPDVAAAAALPLLSGKIALVTGAGDGLGRAIALRYAQEGAKVALADVNERTGRQTFNQLRSRGGEGIYIHAGPRCGQHRRGLIQAVVDAYGRLDIACNSAAAGNSGEPMGARSELPWHDQVDLDLAGLFCDVRVQLEAMLPKGGGVIVNVASLFERSVSAREEAALYGAAKLVGLTKMVASHYGERGIRVNTVGPAFIPERLPPHALSQVRTSGPGCPSHWGHEQADEVVALVAWLSSDQSSFVTGAYYPIN